MATQSQPSQQLGITLPITTEFKLIAERFSQLCPFSEKAQQIRHNTLAVCAVNAYLQLMEIPTDLAGSDSWKPMMQMMANVADLKIPGVGYLSCRSLLLEEETCHIPPEAWHHRAGYIAVMLNEAENQATLLGFTPTVQEQETVSLSEFVPIEFLIDHIHNLRADAVKTSITPSPSPATSPASIPSAASPMAKVRSAITQLGAWASGAVSSSWQAADALINPTDMNFAFRTTAELAETDRTSRRPATDISRAKLIDLGLQLGQSVRVALVVHLAQTTKDRTGIILQVRPLGDSPYLDEGLTLSVFDENDTLVMVATSRAIDNYIQIQLSGQPGEYFSVQVNLAEATFTEQFII